jgi:hypothetical protein
MPEIDGSGPEGIFLFASSYIVSAGLLKNDRNRYRLHQKRMELVPLFFEFTNFKLQLNGPGIFCDLVSDFCGINAGQRRCRCTRRYPVTVEPEDDYAATRICNCDHIFYDSRTNRLGKLDRRYL